MHYFETIIFSAVMNYIHANAWENLTCHHDLQLNCIRGMKDELYNSKQEVLSTEIRVKAGFDDQIQQLSGAVEETSKRYAAEKSAREAAEARLAVAEKEFRDQVRCSLDQRSGVGAVVLWVHGSGVIL